MTRIAPGTLAVLAYLACCPAMAHHSVSAEFDRSLTGELEGEITQVWFTNPHIRYRLTVTRDDGTREVSFEWVAG
jgi:hypothetical protein